jgi:hypothetical protein
MKERDLSELRRASDEYELVRPLEDAERKPRAQHRRDTVRIGDEESDVVELLGSHDSFATRTGEAGNTRR